MRGILAVLLTASVLLPACSSGGGEVEVEPEFLQFVQDLVESTADDTDPVDLNGLAFSDLLEDDETAFDGLLQGAGS